MQISVCLHNVMQLTSSTFYSPISFVDSDLSDGSIKEGDWWRIVETDAGGLRNIRKPKGGRQEENGKILQSVLISYVVSAEGAVEWQWEYICWTGPSHRWANLIKVSMSLDKRIWKKD